LLTITIVRLPRRFGQEAESDVDLIAPVTRFAAGLHATRNLRRL